MSRSKIQTMNIKDRFWLYQERVDKMVSTRLIKNKGLKSEMTITGNKESGTGINIAWPDEDDLRSFLVTFRLFILKGEPVFLNRLYNLLIDNVSDKEVKDMLLRNRPRWHEIHRMGSIVLYLQNEEMKPEKIVDLFMSGDIFHIDLEKREVLKSLNFFTEQLIKHHFLDYLFMATRHIYFIDSVSAKVLKEHLLIDESLITS